MADPPPPPEKNLAPTYGRAHNLWRGGQNYPKTSSSSEAVIIIMTGSNSNTGVVDKQSSKLKNGHHHRSPQQRCDTCQNFSSYINFQRFLQLQSHNNLKKNQEKYVYVHNNIFLKLES
jgi:hypothetical protein